MTSIRPLLLSLLCAWHWPATAQITVPSATLPLPGDTLQAISALPPADLQPLYTAPGGNQQWDFSQLAIGQRIATRFRPANEGAFAANFPSANLVVIDPGGETYYRTSNGPLEILGRAGRARGAPTDTFDVPFVATFSSPIVQRGSTVNFFDVRSQSVDAIISLPAVAALPESLRTIQADWPEFPILGFRIRFVYSLTDVVDAWGTLQVPGLTAPRPVLRVNRTTYRDWFLDFYDGFVWYGNFYQTFHGRFGSLRPNPAWLFFLDSIKGPFDALMGGISGGGSEAIADVGGCDTCIVDVNHIFLSATDKEELAAIQFEAGSGVAAPGNLRVRSMALKDFNVPPPTLRLVREPSGLALFWPTSASGWTLQSTERLTPSDWQPFPGTPTPVGAENRLPVGLTTPTGFFRLMKP